ncbi:FprA family A-type flavoprotein [Dissulfurirhabdus thermomarina]|uniref:FprA family A-type flavoprotein n=1 Tax=Dissulfurirhabdus thermomarina TaxID=1765737 RepID=A0A6N9TKZ5_DISTH|nr:flavodoxin domain-containing protein [Dissulfurirhabdus thermomarina]NDY41952.1 FprA family A-type flavoprotein [Dissulfurirhabdus thermomarina]NMX22936.1 FprA family A-type flavoprotein [Dissulfurirhabdus thermomarina]
MQPVEIKKDIFWVGAVDWNIRDFHGYSTWKGSTYNAYLVMDEKITLFDTVRAPFKNDLLHRIHNIVDPSKIDYLVVNHVEMDHSGCVGEVIDRIRPEKVFCSAMGKKALIDHYHREDWPLEVVPNGGEISLGARTVRFLETRMLHWPDSMFSYLVEDRVLISSDAFGQHWATSQRFDDEVDTSELMDHAAKYYANILLLYSPLVTKLLASVQEMGIPIDVIAPDHGLIWRREPGRILEAYGRWARQEGEPRAVVIYDTMWHSTEKMAKAVADGIQDEGVPVRIMNLRACHRSDVMTEVLGAKALVFGSSTLNNGLLPRMAGMLAYMKGLRPANKLGAAFGSYGWSGEAVKLMTQAMEEMKFQVVDPGVRIKYVPTHDSLRDCVELGRKVGRSVKEAF